MAKEELIEAEGKVIEVTKGGFRVQLDEQYGDHQVLCHPGGKIRKNFIRIVLGDHVKVEITPYDPSRGRITWRDK
jgi:translation initiation factor IF-1